MPTAAYATSLETLKNWKCCFQTKLATYTHFGVLIKLSINLESHYGSQTACDSPQMYYYILRVFVHVCALIHANYIQQNLVYIQEEDFCVV